MAEYTGGETGVKNKKLTPGVADTITLSMILQQVQVSTDGKADIYVEFGLEADPVIGGRRSWRVPATDGAATLPTHPSGDDLIYGHTIIKLLSAGAPTYSVGVVGFTAEESGTGPAGPAGPQGDPGPAGPQGLQGPPAPTLTQTFAVASTQWVIHHSLGPLPDVTTTDLNKDELQGDVAYPDDSTVTVTFAMPFTGIARLRA